MPGTLIPDEDKELIYCLFEERAKTVAEFKEVSEKQEKLRKALKALSNTGIGEKFERSGHSIGRLYKQYLNR